MPVELTEDEARLLVDGLRQWGGPARPTDELAVALGFRDISDFMAQAKRIRVLIESSEPLTSRDAARALVAAEIVFASDVFGAGVEWSTVTGMSDDETIRVLRQVQRKLVGHYDSLFDQ